MTFANLFPLKIGDHVQYNNGTFLHLRDHRALPWSNGSICAHIPNPNKKDVEIFFRLVAEISGNVPFVVEDPITHSIIMVIEQRTQHGKYKPQTHFSGIYIEKGHINLFLGKNILTWRTQNLQLTFSRNMQTKQIWELIMLLGDLIGVGFCPRTKCIDSTEKHVFFLESISPSLRSTIPTRETIPAGSDSPRMTLKSNP